MSAMKKLDELHAELKRTANYKYARVLADCLYELREDKKLDINLANNASTNLNDGIL